MLHDVGYESKVGKMLSTLVYGGFIVIILWVADSLGVPVIAMAQGYLGMVFVSVGWDGYDDDGIELIECQSCGKLIDADMNHCTECDWWVGGYEEII